MKRTTRSVGGVVGAVGAAVVLGIYGVGAHAQPEPPPPPAGERSPEMDRDALRARLQRRLDEAKRQQERLEGALKQLDAGASTEEVRAGMENDMRSGRARPPEGGPGGGRRDDGPGGPEGGGDGRPRRFGDRTPGRTGPGGGGQPPVDRDMVVKWLDEHPGPMADRLKGAIKNNPREADAMINRLAPRIREFMAERDPQTRELRIEEFKLGPEVFDASKRLAEAMRSERPAAGPSGVAEAEAALRDVLGRQFDVRAKLHARELETLEARLRELREEVAKGQGGREEMIDKRFREIVDGIKAREERRGKEPKAQ